ncbi:MAG: O-antigen ligase family protein, partial [Patescibacteria group bacterium]
MLGLFELLHIFLLFLILGKLFLDERFRKNYLSAIFFVGVVLSFISLIQIVSPGFLKTGWEGFRVGSAFDNPDYFASVIIFPLFIGIFLFLKAEFCRRVYFLPGILLIAFGLFFTGARGAIVATGLGLAAIFFFYAVRDRSRFFPKSVARRILIFILLIAILGAGLWFFSADAGGRFSPSAIKYGLLESSRLLTWQAGLRGFFTHPILGWGYQNFNAAYNSFYTGEMLKHSYSETWFDNAHNFWIDWLVWGGIVGFGLFVWLLCKSARRLWEIKNREQDFALIFGALLAAYLLQGIFIFDTLISLFLFFVVLALVASFGDEPRAESRPKTGLCKMTAFLSLAFMLFIFNSAVFARIKDSGNALSGRAAFLRGNAEDGKKYFAASFAGPFREEILAEYAASFISFANGTNSWETVFSRQDAEEIFDLSARAAKNNPKDPRYAILSGDLGIILGEKDRGILLKSKNILENSLSEHKERQKIYQQLVKINLLLSLPDEAEAAARKAISFYGDVPEPHYYLSLALMSQGKDGEGFAELEKAKKLGYSMEDASVILLAATYWGNKGDLARVRDVLRSGTEYIVDARLYAMLGA